VSVTVGVKAREQSGEGRLATTGMSDQCDDGTRSNRETDSCNTGILLLG
jgi:hypothetical protein